VVFVVLGEYWYTRHKHIEEFIVSPIPSNRKGSHHASALP